MAREMKDSGIEWIGEIPRNWGICRLRFLCNILTGNQDTQDNDPDGKYPFYVRSPIVEKSNSFTFEGDDILMAGDGVGAGKVFHYVSGKYGCHQRVYSLQKITGISRRFLYYYLQNRFYISIETANSKSTVDSVRLNMLQDFSVTIPNCEEQQSIAVFLDTQCAHIDSVIEETRAAIEEYKKLKQSVITQAVTKGIRPNRKMRDSGIEWIGEIPKEWDSIISRFVINQIGDVDHYMPVSIDEGKPYIMTGDLKTLLSKVDFHKCKKISEDDYHKLCKKIQPCVGDVIFARYATIGTVCYVDVEVECIISYSCVTVKPNKDLLNGYYLFYYLQSSAFMEDVRQYINSNTQGNVGIEALYKVKIPLSNLCEQSEIITYLDEKTAAIDSLIQKKEQLISELEAYKKSLIYEYVTGKKEVPVHAH